MPVGNRSAESALADTYLKSILGHRYNATGQGNVWSDKDGRAHCVVWFLDRLFEVYTENEASGSFNRAAQLADFEERLWLRHRGDASLARRGAVISSRTAGQIFDLAYERLLAIEATL
jgi:hypothetical protein